MQRGIRKDGVRLYPAMPYTSYRLMADADVLAIKAYFLSLPAVRRENRLNTLIFPFNQRWSMIFWSLAFVPNTRFAPNTAKSAEWNRGAYIAEALAHPANATLRAISHLRWTTIGSSQALSPPGGVPMTLHPTKARASAHGVTRRSSPISPRVTPLGEGRHQGLWARRSTTVSVRSIDECPAPVTYLRSIPSVASSEPATIAPPAPASAKKGAQSPDALGRKVFAQACVRVAIAGPA